MHSVDRVPEFVYNVGVGPMVGPAPGGPHPTGTECATGGSNHHDPSPAITGRTPPGRASRARRDGPGGPLRTEHGGSGLGRRGLRTRRFFANSEGPRTDSARLAAARQEVGPREVNRGSEWGLDSGHCPSPGVIPFGVTRKDLTMSVADLILLDQLIEIRSPDDPEGRPAETWGSEWDEWRYELGAEPLPIEPEPELPEPAYEPTEEDWAFYSEWSDRLEASPGFPAEYPAAGYVTDSDIITATGCAG